MRPKIRESAVLQLIQTFSPLELTPQQSREQVLAEPHLAA